MCVNYTIPLEFDLPVHFGAPAPVGEYPAEAFPGYPGPIVIRSPDREDERVTARAIFGLIPSWSKDEKFYARTYNARAETADTKPSFRAAWRHRRWCLVPARAFFEPCYESGRPVRWRIHRKDEKPFAIAGIWETWKHPEGREVRSFSMLTLNADHHPLMKRFHAPGDEKRSVVLLGPADYDRWLSAEDEDARDLLRLFDPNEYTSEPAPRPRRSRSDSGAPPSDETQKHLF